MSDIDYRKEITRWLREAGARWGDIRTLPELYRMYDRAYIERNLHQMGLSDGLDRIIYTVPVTDDTAFAVFMHEMGHIMRGHKTRWPWMTGEEILHRENEAWEWAFDHVPEVTEEMIRVARRSFGTYTDAYRDAVDESRFHKFLRGDTARDSLARAA